MEKKSQLSTHVSDACFFLGGQPRSGTTLLSSILRSTPSHFQAFEIHVRKPSFIVGLNSQYTKRIFRDLGISEGEYDIILKSFDLNRMNLGSWAGPKEEVSAEQLSGKETSNFLEELSERCLFVASLMRMAAKNHGKQTWGYKILVDILYADKFAQIHPNAKFILIVRDPRDNAISILDLNKQRQTRNQQNFYDDMMGAANGWQHTIGGSIELLKEKNINYVVTRYEDIVLDTENELGRLSEFLNLDLKKGLDFHSKGFISAHTQRFKHHDNLKNPINSASVGKWKGVLSDVEMAIFREHCGALMCDLDYEV